MHSLPIFVRLQGRPVILVGAGPVAAEKRRTLERAGAVIVAEESAAVLAIVAVDDEAKAKAAVTRLRARGILVNAADRPELCDFTLPAIVDRDPVIVAIGTGGASAGLAGVLRERLEKLLPEKLGAFAEQMQAMKHRLRVGWPDHRARRAEIARLLDEAEL